MNYSIAVDQSKGPRGPLSTTTLKAPGGLWGRVENLNSLSALVNQRAFVVLEQKLAKVHYINIRCVLNVLDQQGEIHTTIPVCMKHQYRTISPSY